MDRKKFAKHMAENMSISPTQANIIIDAFTENLGQVLFEGHPVSLDEFGIFVPTTKYSKKHSNPSIDVKFIAGDLLKDKIAS